jgi:hypothetical protein
VLASSIIKAIALAMEAASTSGMSVNVCQTTQRNNPEDSHLHIRRRENLKSHILVTSLTHNKRRCGQVISTWEDENILQNLS